MNHAYNKMASNPYLPYYTRGTVIRGFGRGSKELGIPTANFPESVVDQLPGEFSCGVYYGWAKLNEEGTVYKMVMSIGWNPHYENTKKSMETHILHEFPEDFYGADLQVCITGFIRNEKKFGSLDELIAAIKSDISIADQNLSSKEDENRKKLSYYFVETKS